MKVYLRGKNSWGAAINTNIAKPTPKVLIQRYLDIVGNIDINSSSWAKSFSKRMGFIKRAKISAQVSIPGGARKDIEYLFHHNIATMVERHCIPHSVILNIDQTPLKYVSVGNFTLDKKEAKSVSVEGSNNKRCIIATFGISLNNNFLLLYS